MSTSATIHFYGGIGTIGGTKIIVQEGEFRVLFDFGLNYAPGGDFWSARIQPRTGTARLRDLMALGYVPAIDGLYKPADAASAGLEPGESDRTQVFISHLHLDHMAVADLIADPIPVWMHADSLRLFRAVATTGEQPAVPVGARAFEWFQPIQVGPIKVTPVPVDHDIPGATALLIETSAGTVVYSGDLRLHGAHPERVEQFIRAARSVGPQILLIEGTRLGEAEPTPERPGTLPEPAVPGRVVEILKETQGLGLITLYPRNTERIEQIIAALPQTGRTLVLSAEMAHVYQAMGGDLRQVAIYQRHRDRQALAQGTAEGWLRELFTSGVKVLDAAAVRADESRYLLQLFYWDINELVDLKPGAGSVFIHSNGEPLGRFDPAFELFARWLDAFGLKLESVPSTGHAAHADLLAVVKQIAPAILMPIHSRTPELLEVEGQKRILPELGAKYDIVSGERLA
jgi:ribonuclease J